MNKYNISAVHFGLPFAQLSVPPCATPFDQLYAPLSAPPCATPFATPFAPLSVAPCATPFAPLSVPLCATPFDLPFDQLYALPFDSNFYELLKEHSFTTHHPASVPSVASVELVAVFVVEIPLARLLVFLIRDLIQQCVGYSSC